MTDLAAAQAAVESEFGVAVVVRGGGRGWSASTEWPQGVSVTVRGASKMEAIAALHSSLRSRRAERLLAAEAAPESEDGATTEPDAQDAPGIGPITRAVLDGAAPPVAQLNLCKCGCGLTTKRTFYPGHDARYHTMEAAKAAGLSVEDYRAKLKKDRNERVAAKRRAQRAAIKKGAAKIEAAAQAGTLVPGSVPTNVVAFRPVPKPAKRTKRSRRGF